jgi:hypothetical protein
MSYGATIWVLPILVTETVTAPTNTNGGIEMALPKAVTLPRVLAVDPGVSTGLAWTTPSTPAGAQLFTTRVIKTESLAHSDKAVLEIVRQHWDMVLVEKFATSGQLSKYGLYTIELVGACAALAWATGAELRIQPPQYRYPWLDVAARALNYGHTAPGVMGAPRVVKLKDGGGHLIHEVDALAHLLGYLEQVYAYSIKGITATHRRSRT